MKKWKPLTFACGMAFAVAAPVASAGAVDDIYLSGFAGGGFMNNSDADLTTPGTSTSAEIEHETGFITGGAVGISFMRSLRMEIEGSYRKTAFDSFQADGTVAVEADGAIRVLAGMVNGFYDIDTGGPFTPYFGAGVGGAFVDLVNFATPPGTPELSDGDFQFAYQGIAGVGYKLTQSVSLGVEYRFFGTLDPKFEDNVVGVPTGLRSEFQTHNVMGRITIHFGK